MGFTLLLLVNYTRDQTNVNQIFLAPKILMHAPTLTCRGCGKPLTQSLVDLGAMPLANSYVKPSHTATRDASYPLHAYVCDHCWLVQVPPMATPSDIFSDYAYFSSFSDTWLAHCRAYASAMIDKLGLNSTSHIIEIASNDGAVLTPFQQAGIPVLGIEPAANIAAYANEKGIPTRCDFFGRTTAKQLVAEGIRADLMVANNVLAHVPDLHDFVAGFAVVLKPHGVITFEFPHLLEMLKHTQFDTIYHEHFSYLSLTALAPIFAAHGLVMTEVERLPTHGGSLRVYVRHAGAEVTPSIAALLADEAQFGLTTITTYRAFDAAVRGLKTDLLAMLTDLRASGKRVVAYGAPAKGNTLLNYCGIDTQLVAYTVDRNPQKQGCLLPGTRLPIHAPEYLLADKPDIVLILPWNITPEVMGQMQAIRTWGGQFLVAVPEVKLL
jgi:predicted TPR repeat methyltransferase